MRANRTAIRGEMCVHPVAASVDIRCRVEPLPIVENRLAFYCSRRRLAILRANLVSPRP